MNFFNTIRSRLTFGTLALTLIPLLLLGAILLTVALRESRLALEERAKAQLTSVSNVKQSEIKSFVGTLRNELDQLASSADVIEVTRAMTEAFPKLPAQLPVPISEARGKLREWYTKDFADEFAEANPGSTIDFAAIADSLGDSTVGVQYLYVASNKEEDRSQLIDAGDASDYTAAHRKFHPYMLRVLEKSSYFDLHISDIHGNLVYTSAKEPDIATDLINGPLRDTGMGEVARKVIGRDDRQDVWMSDLAPFYPAVGEYSSFIAVPIEFNGETIGTLIGQFPVDRLNNLLTYGGAWKAAGLGESGETYLVGPDKKARSNSRFLLQDEKGFFDAVTAVGVSNETRLSMASRDSTVGFLTVDTRGSQEGLGGKTGITEYPDYRKVPVVGHYAPLEMLNQKWAILSEIDVAEAYGPVETVRKQLTKYAIPLLLGMAILGVLAALFLANSINKPLSHFKGVVGQIAGGDSTARVKSASRDEIGDLARAFDGLLDERVATLEAASRENEQLNNSIIEIMMSVGQLAQRDLTVKVPVTADVTGAVSDAINLMTNETASTLNQVMSISNNVAQASNRVKERSDQVLEVAQKSGSEVQAASQELATAASAITAIAEQARHADASATAALNATQSALDIVRSTVEGITASRDQIRETEKRIKRLGERSQEISGIVNIINQIAERTSVLALNASMQAVAAGDAGRGFAVVADEVKRLAENARQATQQISGLVNAIQADSTETMQAMNQTITQVVDISKLAERAGEQMNHTRAATDGLANSVRQITATTLEQAKASDVLLHRAQQLEASNRTTLTQLGEQNKETANLLDYAKSLLESVRVFKLPN